MQNQNYIYIAIGVILVGALGFFIWSNQSASTPSSEEENAQQQATTTNEMTSDEQEGTQVGEAEQRNESDMEFQRDMADTSGEDETGGGNTGAGTVSSEQTNTDTNNTETTSGEAAQQVDPTAGWRTYRNNSFGIRFRVPSEWKLSENSQAGEFTMQIYSGETDDKTAEFNLLFYPAELDRDREGNFAETVNGEGAYVETNNCPADVRCVLKKVIFPLEEGEVTGNTWSGDVLEVSLITGGIATNATRSTLNNILDSLTFTTN